jgi:hypothetical protein
MTNEVEKDQELAQLREDHKELDECFKEQNTALGEAIFELAQLREEVARLTGLMQVRDAAWEKALEPAVVRADELIEECAKMWEEDEYQTSYQQKMAAKTRALKGTKALEPAVPVSKLRVLLRHFGIAGDFDNENWIKASDLDALISEAEK